MPHSMDTAEHGPQTYTAAQAASPANSAKDKPLHDDPVCLPSGLHPITLTAEEADTIRKLLDDPEQKTYSGNDLPKADGSGLRKKNQ